MRELSLLFNTVILIESGAVSEMVLKYKNSIQEPAVYGVELGRWVDFLLMNWYLDSDVFFKN